MAPTVTQFEGILRDGAGRKYPLHVVSSWLGHSAVVVNKYFLQIRDDHLRQAAESYGISVQHSAKVKCSHS